MSTSAVRPVLADTAARILDVAEDLFANTGFTETTLRDIATPLGLTTAGVLHAFGKKSRIYAAVLDRVAITLDRFVDEVENARDNDCVSQLTHLFLGFVKWTQTYPSYNRLTMRELLDNSERALQARHWPLAPALRRMVAILERGRATGIFRDVDPVIALFHIIGSATYFGPALPTITRTDGKRSARRLQTLYRNTVLDLHLRSLLSDPKLLENPAAHAASVGLGRSAPTKTKKPAGVS
jgi:TetR/AcrR family transcriptional regulator